MNVTLFTMVLYFAGWQQLILMTVYFIIGDRIGRIIFLWKNNKND
jgi:uncharacterized membrane protein